tara:strand:- start:246 stop:656 length:411 start_codon:yes stop_codon:yes gene_type:complete
MSREGTYLRISGTHTGVNGAGHGTPEETTLQFPQDGGAFKSSIWLLVSFHYVRTDGTATDYIPRLGQAAGWSDNDINERATYSSTAVGTPINDVYAQPIPCLVDSNGRLYFRPGFVGASTDNDGAYEFWFKKAKGS